jgi:hypothetical protein
MAATDQKRNFAGIIHEPERRPAMHTVMWTFHVPEGTSKQDLVNTINASAHTYLGIPGLIRKYYGIAQDGKTIVGIYLWKSKRQADAFYKS